MIHFNGFSPLIMDSFFVCKLFFNIINRRNEMSKLADKLCNDLASVIKDSQEHPVEDIRKIEAMIKALRDKEISASELRKKLEAFIPTMTVLSWKRLFFRKTTLQKQLNAILGRLMFSEVSLLQDEVNELKVSIGQKQNSNKDTDEKKVAEEEKISKKSHVKEMDTQDISAAPSISSEHVTFIRVLKQKLRAFFSNWRKLFFRNTDLQEQSNAGPDHPTSSEIKEQKAIRPQEHEKKSEDEHHKPQRDSLETSTSSTVLTTLQKKKNDIDAPSVKEVETEERERELTEQEKIFKEQGTKKSVEQDTPYIPPASSGSASVSASSQNDQDINIQYGDEDKEKTDDNNTVFLEYAQLQRNEHNVIEEIKARAEARIRKLFPKFSAYNPLIEKVNDNIRKSHLRLFFNFNKYFNMEEMQKIYYLEKFVRIIVNSVIKYDPAEKQKMTDQALKRIELEEIAEIDRRILLTNKRVKAHRQQCDEMLSVGIFAFDDVNRKSFIKHSLSERMCREERIMDAIYALRGMERPCYVRHIF